MQLYGMYNQGSDFRDPELWASIFTDDGVFRPASGQEVPQWTGQNRPFVDTAKPAISGARDER